GSGAPRAASYDAYRRRLRVRLALSVLAHLRREPVRVLQRRLDRGTHVRRRPRHLDQSDPPPAVIRPENRTASEGLPSEAVRVITVGARRAVPLRETLRSVRRLGVG